MSSSSRGRIVITGGAGFVGAHLGRILSLDLRASPDHIDQAANAARDVLMFDRDPLTQADLPPGVRVLQSDVRDRAAVRGAVHGAWAVIHAASALPNGRVEEFDDINVEGTRAVLDVSREHGVERIIHLSTASVYGLRNEPWSEQDAPLANGPYASSRREAEQLCDKARQRGQCVTVLRPRTTVGPQRLGIFHLLFEWLRQGRRIPMLGRGDNRYQLLDIEDLGAAVRLLLESPAETANDTFNLGASEYGSVAEDLGALIAYAESGSRLVPLPAGLSKVALGVFRTLGLSPLHGWIYGSADCNVAVNTDKLQSIGWSPQHSNVQALCSGYDWYCKNLFRLRSATGRSNRSPRDEGILRLLRRAF